MLRNVSDTFWHCHPRVTGLGLHHGEFVGGIIGQKTLRYDIWGIDVMKGTACESGGIPGQVMPSPGHLFSLLCTRHLVEKRYGW